MSALLGFVVGVVTGISLVAAAVYYILSFFFHDPERGATQGPRPPNSATFQLPPVLIAKISDESCKGKESCWALNFVLYFLFRELRNSEGIRRWILRKLSLEFDELLSSSVLGKFFSSISIQNVDLGQNFPVVNWLKTSRVELHPVFKNISTLDILVDLDYSGGFQFAIQAETHLKHSAFLSVTFNEVKGQARLQFATEPYAHWSFSFAQNPDIDISVVSQLYGKSFSQVTSIIASQLKRNVRKKHTLPMYKIRYKPFFARVEHIVASLVPDSAPAADLRGTVKVSLIECRGLLSTLLHGNIYAVLSIGDYDWVAAYSVDSADLFIVRDLVYIKTARREAALDFTLALEKEVVVVVGLGPSSTPTQYLGFEMGDEVLAVDGKAVTSVRQCVRNFKNSSCMKVIWRIRRKFLAVAEPVSEKPAPPPPVPPTPQGEEDPNGMISESSQTELRDPGLAHHPDADLPSTTPSLSRRNSFAEVIDAAATAAFTLQEAEGGSTPPPSPPAPRRWSYSFKPNEARQFSIVRTGDTPCCRDPIFMESFELDMEESSRFLNVSLWSGRPLNGGEPVSPTSSPSKRSKSSQLSLEKVTFGGERLVGTLSVPIADVIAECSTTGLGYFIKDYYLRSPDGNAAEARENPLTAYSGFEPHMCYGKVTLSFLFKPAEEGTKRKDLLEDPLDPIELATEAYLDAAPSSPNEEIQPHQFVRMHFRNATVCNYCNKKIWLKEAFACRICNMKCHKKCNERCLANTVCRGEGFYPSATSTTPASSRAPPPEIITTGSDLPSTDAGGEEEADPFLPPNTPPGESGSGRRRTLGGLLVSAVQQRSAQLKRAGSATNLLHPNVNSTGGSRSLPPSPKASPTISRKGSMGRLSGNPFDLFGVESGRSVEEEIGLAVEELTQHPPHDDLVALAKEGGRELYAHLGVAERKKRLEELVGGDGKALSLLLLAAFVVGFILSRTLLACVEEEMESVSTKGCDGRRVQALALLILLYSSGLATLPAE